MPRDERRARLLLKDNPNPALQSALAKVTARLRFASSTAVASEYGTVVDVLNSNPTNQADADRKPAAALSANGLPIATWDGTDVLVWPVAASNNQTTKTGFALWFRVTSVAPANVSIIEFNGGVAPGAKFSMQLATSRVVISAYINAGTTGRSGTSAAGVITANTWHWLRVSYDSSIGGDLSAKYYVDGVNKSLTYANIGAGGTLGVLPTVTGNALIGGQSNSDTPFFSPVGDFGPNIYCIAGDLTAAEEVALMNLERPT